LTSLGVTNNATVGGTLGVTGASTLAALGAGASTLASLTVTAAATVGTTFAVAGATIVYGLLTAAGGVSGNVTGNASTATTATTATTANAVAAGAVTNAGLANMSASTIKGQIVGGSGAPVDMTAVQAAAVLSAAPLTGRQGGSATNWNTTGTTTQTIVAQHMEVGSITVALAAGTYVPGSIITCTPSSITVPIGFSNLPIAFGTSAGAGVKIEVYPTGSNTLGIFASSTQSTTSSGYSTSVHWLAIGPN